MEIKEIGMTGAKGERGKWIDGSLRAAGEKLGGKGREGFYGY